MYQLPQLWGNEPSQSLGPIRSADQEQEDRNRRWQTQPLFRGDGEDGLCAAVGEKLLWRTTSLVCSRGDGNIKESAWQRPQFQKLIKLIKHNRLWGNQLTRFNSPDVVSPLLPPLKQSLGQFPVDLPRISAEVPEHQAAT